MDIPRRKERKGPDKLTSELLFFCTWITRGRVPIDALTTFCPHSDGSYYRYATDLYLCGAVPRCISEITGISEGLTAASSVSLRMKKTGCPCGLTWKASIFSGWPAWYVCWVLQM